MAEMDGLKVFSGSSHPALAQAICKCLAIAPGRLSSTRFSNENLKVRIEENVREQDVFVVQTSAPPLSENIVELLILLDALTHASARRVTAVPVLCDRLRAEGLEDTVVVAADVGEAKDAAVFAKHLGLPIAVIDKRRSGDEERAEAVAVIGDVRGKRCLLVDDEIATGGTIFSATDFLLAQGARGVSAAVVHPVLSGRALERLGASRLERLLVTDTIPIAATSPKIEVLSVAPLLAETITRIHDGRSVSALF